MPYPPVMSPPHLGEAPACPHGYHDCTTCRDVVNRARAACPFRSDDFRATVVIVSKRRVCFRLEDATLNVVQISMQQYPDVLEGGRAEDVWVHLARNVRYRIRAVMVDLDDVISIYERRKRGAARAAPQPPATPASDIDEIEF